MPGDGIIRLGEKNDPASFCWSGLMESEVVSMTEHAEPLRPGEADPMHAPHVDADRLGAQRGVAAGAHGVAERGKQQPPQQQDVQDPQAPAAVQLRMAEWLTEASGMATDAKAKPWAAQATKLIKPLLLAGDEASFANKVHLRMEARGWTVAARPAD